MSAGDDHVNRGIGWRPSRVPKAQSYVPPFAWNIPSLFLPASTFWDPELRDLPTPARYEAIRSLLLIEAVQHTVLRRASGSIRIASPLRAANVDVELRKLRQVICDLVDRALINPLASWPEEPVQVHVRCSVDELIVEIGDYAAGVVL